MFVDWAGQQLENHSDFYRKIICLNRINKFALLVRQQHVLHESSLHAEKMTVWCGLWTGGVTYVMIKIDTLL